VVLKRPYLSGVDITLEKFENRRKEGLAMSALTLVFLGFGVVVLIGFIIILMDKGLKSKKGR